MAARSATSPLVAERRLACHRDDKTRHAHSPLDGYTRWGAQLIAPRPRSPRLCLREERQLLALRLFLALAPAPVPALAPAPAHTLDSSPSPGSHSPFLGERSGSASVHDRAGGSMQVGASVPGLVMSVACKAASPANKGTRRCPCSHRHKNYLSEGGGPRTRDSKPDEEPGESELTPSWAPVARPSTYALRPIT
jgi:hypothetical protein